PRIRDHRAAQRLDQGGLARAIVAYDAEYLVRVEIEIGIVERHDPAIALGQAPGLQDGFSPVHAEFFRIHWSMATARMMRRPTVNSCQRTSTPASARPLRNTPTISAPTSMPMIEPLPPNSEVPPITTAVMASRLAVCPASGETAPMRPMTT